MFSNVSIMLSSVYVMISIVSVMLSSVCNIFQCFAQKKCSCNVSNVYELFYVFKVFLCVTGAFHSVMFTNVSVMFSGVS